MPRRGVAILAAVLLASACGQGVDGTPLAGSPAEPWDPCSIPTQAIEATGLHLAPEGGGWGEGIVVRDWTRCVWERVSSDERYSVIALASTSSTLDDLRGNPNYRDFVPADFGSRTGYRHFYTGFDDEERCGLAIDTTAGVVSFSLNEERAGRDNHDSCSRLLEHATALADYLPPNA
ncbi:DUF3558 family protein [Rhodococcoides yunnanense]|uniref:DUF3558 family protein n=1 Tax=Rhodococcoides yunnanense TaxID=278209 RepID=UPI000933E521